MGLREAEKVPIVVCENCGGQIVGNWGVKVGGKVLCADCHKKPASDVAAPPETCANCGERIGRLETPHVWGDEVVCGGCFGKLKRQQPASDPATRLPPQPAGYSPLAILAMFVVLGGIGAGGMMIFVRWRAVEDQNAETERQKRFQDTVNEIQLQAIQTKLEAEKKLSGYHGD